MIEKWSTLRRAWIRGRPWAKRLDALTARVRPTYLQWDSGEPAAYGPAREFLDIAAIPEDEHIVDVAITTHPEGYKPLRVGPERDELPDWSFRLASANEPHTFHEGWYKATLRIAAEGDPAISTEVVVALGLKKNGLLADLHLKDWDTIGASLPDIREDMRAEGW